MISERFSFCKCGCLEAEHEEPDVFQQFLHTYVPGSRLMRGKCLGRNLLPLDVEQTKTAINNNIWPTITKPCSCNEFDPAFEPLCRMS